MLINRDLSELFENAGRINRETLKKILKDNQYTVFGKSHNFSEIKTQEDYSEKVPILKYKDYEPYIGKMIDGEKNLLTAYEVACYCKTSGTLGNAKFIPVTYKALENYGGSIENFQNSVIKKSGGKRLFINTFRTKLFEKDTEPVLFSECLYKFMTERKFIDINSFVGGELLMFNKNTENIMFAKAWVSLCEKNITVIESIFLYDQLMFFKYLENNFEEIICCMKEKNVPAKLGLSKEITDFLLKINADKERIDEIEKECKKGFDGIAKRLWKNLKLISGVSARSFRSEDLALKKYIGDIKKDYLGYVASECLMGLPIKTDDFGYALIPDHAFFEFIPFGKDKKNIKFIDELEISECYEIIVTNFSGLYRYSIGDVVRVREYIGQTPVVEFMFRKNQILNIAGEKTSTVQIEETIKIMRRSGIRFSRYCVGESNDGGKGKYMIFAVLDEKSIVEPVERISALFDKVLKEKNCDYKDLREMKYIESPEIVLFDNDSYDKFFKENGLFSGHNKPKHIIKKILKKE